MVLIAHGVRASLLQENQGTSSAVQWLRLHASNVGGAGLIPGQGTKTPCAMEHESVCFLETEKQKWPQLWYHGAFPTTWRKTMLMVVLRSVSAWNDVKKVPYHHSKAYNCMSQTSDLR